MSETWAGAIVVTDDPRYPEALVSCDGEDSRCRLVTPRGRVDHGASALHAAASAVTRAMAVDQLRYAGYLGEARDTVTDHRPVAWFLLVAAHRRERPATTGLGGGLGLATWDDVVDGADDQLPTHVRRAHDVITWRRDAGLPYSSTLGELVRRCSRTAAELLHGSTRDAGLGLCGSAARGDFVDGWSDVDLVGWGLQPSSPVVRSLEALVAELEQDYGVRTSLDLADGNGQDLVDGDPLVTPKLQGLLLRGTAEMPVLAGCPPPVPSVLRLADSLDDSIDRLRRFAAQHLVSEAASPQQHAERARRVLAVACHAARSVATVLDPRSSMDLATVAAQLDRRWPANQLSLLLRAYRRLRQTGATDLATADELAARVPRALADFRQLVVSAGIVGRPDPR